MSPTPRNWVSLFGDFEIDGDSILFKGGASIGPEGKVNPALGQILSNSTFSEGRIHADIEFINSTEMQEYACTVVNT